MLHEEMLSVFQESHDPDRHGRTGNSETEGRLLGAEEPGDLFHPISKALPGCFGGKMLGILLAVVLVPEIDVVGTGLHDIGCFFGRRILVAEDSLEPLA